MKELFQDTQVISEAHPFQLVNTWSQKKPEIVESADRITGVVRVYFDKAQRVLLLDCYTNGSSFEQQRRILLDCNNGIYHHSGNVMRLAIQAIDAWYEEVRAALPPLRPEAEVLAEWQARQEENPF